jgi:hypothetical protein
VTEFPTKTAKKEVSFLRVWDTFQKVGAHPFLKMSFLARKN